MWVAMARSGETFGPFDSADEALRWIAGEYVDTGDFESLDDLDWDPVARVIPPEGDF